MATTLNQTIKAPLVEEYLQATRDSGEAGRFLNYKFLQDLFLEFAGTQAFEMASGEMRQEWLSRFQLISDTVFALESLAAYEMEPDTTPG